MIYFAVLLHCYGGSQVVFRTPNLTQAVLYAQELSGDPQCTVTIDKLTQEK